MNDAAIQYYLYEISQFRHLPMINLNAVVPDYGDILVAADEAAEHIDQITRDNYNNRGQSYAAAREHVGELHAQAQRPTAERGHNPETASCDIHTCAWSLRWHPRR